VSLLFNCLLSESRLPTGQAGLPPRQEKNPARAGTDGVPSRTGESEFIISLPVQLYFLTFAGK
jgi:hypothetical protein